MVARDGEGDLSCLFAVMIRLVILHPLEHLLKCGALRLLDMDVHVLADNCETCANLTESAPYS